MSETGPLTGKGIEALRESLPKLHVITPERNLYGDRLRRHGSRVRAFRPPVTRQPWRRPQAPKRISSGNEEAATQLALSPTEAHRQITSLQGLHVIDNVEWNLAYTDLNAALAVARSFPTRSAPNRCWCASSIVTPGRWKIAEINVTPARDGVERKIRQFASLHPRAGPPKGGCRCRWACIETAREGAGNRSLAAARQR